MAEATDPGATVTPPVTDPAASAATVQPTTSTGSEAVTNTGGTGEQQVPFTRFQEVNDKAKAEEERATNLQKELDDFKAQQAQTTSSSDEELDPDVLDLVKRSSAKLGLVSKEELDTREAQIQVRQDIVDLTSQYKDSGIAFDGKKVIDYAKANGMPLGSKQSLDAVYQYMNREAIVEGQRKAAVTAFQEAAKGGGEKAGSKGASAPEEQQPAGLKDRIRQAREKAGFSIT